MSSVGLLLLAGVLLYVLIGYVQARRGARIGLVGVKVVAADGTRLGSPTLRSEKLHLVGRPDHLVRIGEHLIPVEQKPRAWRVHDSHVIQLAAECLLVSEVYGKRPPYGLLVLEDGLTYRVTFTRALEGHLLDTMQKMNTLLESTQEPGPRWLGGRCQGCGFFGTCWE